MSVAVLDGALGVLGEFMSLRPPSPASSPSPLEVLGDNNSKTIGNRKSRDDLTAACTALKGKPGMKPNSSRRSGFALFALEGAEQVLWGDTFSPAAFLRKSCDALEEFPEDSGFDHFLAPLIASFLLCSAQGTVLSMQGWHAGFNRDLCR
ncbi:unnamed protein product [Symbiodinium natans]|uniref:Uncharacterized protein n=1 Tax=Symbiodinium natans TaxID=878477 RepID=A0A812SE44_9DINO|nr:unnamed protein product [Symbiodinium natans]